jgi:hypothetical protein
MWIGRKEGGTAAAFEFDGILARLDDPASGDDGDAVSIGHDGTYAWDTKSMKSL